MRIAIKFKDDVAVMSLNGQFVAGGDGPFLRQKVEDLIAAGTQKLVINFSGVPYIDSTGLGFLAGSRVTAQNNGARMVLASINPHVQKILDEVKLSPFFVIAKDESEALAKVNEEGKETHSSPSPAKKEPKGKKGSSAE